MTDSAADTQEHRWWRLRSLRARLLTGVLVLAAVSLLLVSTLLYAQQRRFALDRLDNQVRAAIMPVAREFERRGIPGRGGFPGPGPRAGNEGGPPDGNGAQTGEPLLPPNVYGQRRDSSGNVLGSVLISYSDDAAPSPPKLPRQVEPDQIITVPARDGGTDYRVYATRDPRGYLTISAVPTADADSQLSRLLATEAMLFGGALLMIWLFGWWILGYGLRPLDELGDAAGRIAEGDLGRRVSPADPDTEVGRLGLRLNAMLSRIESSFRSQKESEQRLRQFLADASHELRTPLAAIRGYAELNRIGAASDPDAVAHAMSRIESEARRMGTLVEDLLTLARLDEQRTPVREPVAVGDLARDAVADARAIDDSDREISLTTTGDDLIVSGDADQLRQVLANLLGNALVHTPPGSPIEVDITTTSGGEAAAVSVRDHGPGIPDGQKSEIFGRFWREAPGRERGPGGAGLGLSIVAAVVERHGGSVRAENPDDGGAQFVVELPLATAPNGHS